VSERPGQGEPVADSLASMEVLEVGPEADAERATVTASTESATSSVRRPGAIGRFAGRGPLALVLGVVACNLVVLRQESSVVSALNDSSFHEIMVRYATDRLRAGHLPLTGWWPYLGLGSPLFLHYQSLGATLTGLIGLVIGPNVAFSVVLYLGVALWPLCIYLSARIFGLSDWQSACAAAISPLVTSVTAVGFEQQSYLWVGFGVWSQMFGMWMLPLSWASTTRAIRTGRGYFSAVLFTSLTLASHFLTGYLTALPLVTLIVVMPSQWRARLRRALIVGIGTVLATLWLVIPLATLGRYAAVNEFLQGTASADSYGARQVLRWLADGSLFDSGNLFPVLTLLVGGGIVLTIWHWREHEVGRLLLCLFGSSLVLFFGRPTLGAVINFLPGSRDLFLRRFLMGVQLAGIYLGGIALSNAVPAARKALRASSRRLGMPPGRFGRVGSLLAGAATIGAVVLALTPSWSALIAQDSRDAADIRYQLGYDATQGPQVQELVAQALALGPGRFFAGMPNDIWGPNFTVGAVPVFKYLANLDVDIVGYTLRTSSLMTDPEEHFDEYEPADFQMFGVRYLIYPVGKLPPIAAQPISHVGQYALWELSSNGYLRVVDTSGVIAADRRNIGAMTENFVRSDQAASGVYPLIAYAGSPAASPTIATTSVSTSAGSVLASSIDLTQGYASATVELRRPAVVVLSASYDPGWQVSIDGQAATTEMLAPALPGVLVAAGRHTVTFRYEAPGYSPLLLLIGLFTFAGFLFAPKLSRHVRRRSSSRPPEWCVI
jgi:Bacterial membrane protein YfhO